MKKIAKYLICIVNDSLRFRSMIEIKEKPALTREISPAGRVASQSRLKLLVLLRQTDGRDVLAELNRLAVNNKHTLDGINSVTPR